MITIRSHTADDYASLPNIDDGYTGRLTGEDRACLQELGRFLVCVQANERFGVILLHNHFAFEDGEQLVQEFHFNTRHITLSPRRGLANDVVPIGVLFESADHRDIRLVGLEFLSALGDVRPISDLDEKVLASVSEILARHRKLKRFGVRLLHDPLDLKDHVLLETCDPEKRVLTCVPTSAAEMKEVNSVPTLFQWMAVRTADNSWSASQECPIHCVMKQACEIVEYPDGRTDHRPGSLQVHTGMRDHDRH
jgi:hypothetical protein